MSGHIQSNELSREQTANIGAANSTDVSGQITGAASEELNESGAAVESPRESGGVLLPVPDSTNLNWSDGSRIRCGRRTVARSRTVRRQEPTTIATSNCHAGTGRNKMVLSSSSLDLPNRSCSPSSVDFEETTTATSTTEEHECSLTGPMTTTTTATTTTTTTTSSSILDQKPTSNGRYSGCTECRLGAQFRGSRDLDAKTELGDKSNKTNSVGNSTIGGTMKLVQSRESSILIGIERQMQSQQQQQPPPPPPPPLQDSKVMLDGARVTAELVSSCEPVDGSRLRALTWLRNSVLTSFVGSRLPVSSTWLRRLESGSSSPGVPVEVGGCQQCGCPTSLVAANSLVDLELTTNSSSMLTDEQQQQLILAGPSSGLAGSLLIAASTANIAAATTTRAVKSAVRSATSGRLNPPNKAAFATGATTTTTTNIGATGGASVSVTSSSVKPATVHTHQANLEGVESKRERKAAKTLAIITGVFVMCWLPFFVMAIAMPLLKFEPHKYVLALLLWLGYVNSMLNPIIYTIFSPDFRKAFKRLLSGPDKRSPPGCRAGARTGRHNPVDNLNANSQQNGARTSSAGCMGRLEWLLQIAGVRASRNSAPDNTNPSPAKSSDVLVGRNNTPSAKHGAFSFDEPSRGYSSKLDTIVSQDLEAKSTGYRVDAIGQSS